MFWKPFKDKSQGPKPNTSNNKLNNYVRQRQKPKIWKGQSQCSNAPTLVIKLINETWRESFFSGLRSHRFSAECGALDFGELLGDLEMHYFCLKLPLMKYILLNNLYHNYTFWHSLTCIIQVFLRFLKRNRNNFLLSRPGSISLLHFVRFTHFPAPARVTSELHCARSLCVDNR